MAKWIDANEKLPPDSRHVLVCLLKTIVFIGHYNHGKKKWRLGLETKDRKDEIVAVTHWKPLDKPPADDGGCQDVECFQGGK